MEVVPIIGDGQPAPVRRAVNEAVEVSEGARPVDRLVGDLRGKTVAGVGESSGQTRGKNALGNPILAVVDVSRHVSDGVGEGQHLMVPVVAVAAEELARWPKLVLEVPVVGVVK